MGGVVKEKRGCHLGNNPFFRSRVVSPRAAMRLMRPGVLHIERAPLLPHPPGLKGPADPDAQEGGDEGLYDVKRQERRHGKDHSLFPGHGLVEEKGEAQPKAQGTDEITHHRHPGQGQEVLPQAVPGPGTTADFPRQPGHYREAEDEASGGPCQHHDSCLALIKHRQAHTAQEHPDQHAGRSPDRSQQEPGQEHHQGLEGHRHRSHRNGHIGTQYEECRKEVLN